MNVALRTLLAAATTAALTLSACGSPGAGSGDGPSVLASFYPLHWAVEKVMAGTDGSVDVLTKPGSDAHGLELSPQQVASLGKADLVIYLGGMQPEVDNAVPASGAERTLDVADVVNLAPLADPHSHDHGDHDEHGDDEHGDDHDGHDHGDLDPHFWLDPERMGLAVQAIAEQLAELNPEQAETYRANATSTVEELNTIDEEYAAGLATCQRREFITTHAAFQYLAARYDLTEIGISGINPDAEPSPARIAAIHDEAKRHGVTTIFFEALTSPAVAESIAGDLGLKTAILDPLEGITDKSPGDDYPAVMRANLEALRSANDCS